MNTIWYFMKRQMNHLEFKVGFGILLLGQILRFWDAYIYNIGSYSAQYYRDAAANFSLINTGRTGASVAIHMIYPLVATLLCAVSRKKEERTKEALYSVVRMGRKNYIRKNAIATVLVTAGAVWFCLLVNQLLCMIAFPVTGGITITAMPAIWKMLDYDAWSLFGSLSENHVYLYNYCLSIVVAMIAGAMALLTYAVSILDCVKKVNHYVIGGAVYVLCIAIDLLAEKMNWRPFCLLSYFDPSGIAVTNMQCMIVIGGMYAIGSLLIWKERKRYEYL